MTNTTQTKTNGSNIFSSTGSSINEPISKTPMTFTLPAETEEKTKENGTSLSTQKTEKNHTDSKEENTEYYASLKGLNESVANWIKTHVDKNPLCILTPIFKDYEKYLLEIEAKKKEKVNISGADEKFNLFGQNTLKTPEKSMFSSSTISLVKNTDENLPVASKTTLSFGNTANLGTKQGFSFGSGTPFTFANVTKPSTEEKKPEATENDEDEPPKVEFTPVVEEDHVFSKRCKVFVKKDGNFGDRGVGQLFLKPVSGSEKVQLIVRADTNLGNLLLNLILSESIPTQRMGKNNVMLVCIPTPEAKPPPVPILLRVKTSEEADELLKVLEENKK